MQYKSEIRNQIAKELIHMGANPYSQNRDGKSPVDMAVMVENEELTEIFGRVEKPLQDETEKFRVPGKSSGIFPLKIPNYNKFICTKDTTVEYLKEKVADYAAIAGGKKTKYRFKLVSAAGMMLFTTERAGRGEKIQIYTETEPIYNHFPDLPETSEIQWCSRTS